MNKKTAELRDSLYEIPQYLRHAYQVKYKIDFVELLVSHEKALTLGWRWKLASAIWTFGIVVPIVLYALSHPQKPTSQSVAMVLISGVTLFALTIFVWIYSEKSLRSHRRKSEEIEGSFVQLRVLTDRLGYSPECGRHGFGPTAIRANLVIKARELLKTKAETIEMRQNPRYGSALLRSMIDLELTRQKLFDEMFESVRELGLNDPSSGQPYERGEIFAQAESMLSRTRVTPSDSVQASASTPTLTLAPAPPSQKPAGTP